MEFLLLPALKRVSLQIFCFSWPGLKLAFDKYLWMWKGLFSAIFYNKKKLSNYPFPLFTGWTPPASYHISIWAPNADLPVVPAVEALVTNSLAPPAGHSLYPSDTVSTEIKVPEVETEPICLEEQKYLYRQLLKAQMDTTGSSAQDLPVHPSSAFWGQSFF